MSMIVPTRLPNGSRVWMDLEVQDFIAQLHELDPRLALVQHTDHSWSIWRVAEDGSEHMIARSKRYAKLDESVIERLRRGDTRRRGTKVIEELIAQNERVVAGIDSAMEDRLAEAQDRVLSAGWKGRIPLDGEIT